MITKQFIKQNLECSDVYAQKLIEHAQGDEKMLYELFIQKRVERQNRVAIVEVR
ncbi:hypothetical protein QI340_00195 [Staphylococcus saprophyticus]|uniref:hypothetical protein n=1 Tax=Staphylococcus saprophyticus TaxID=29385 RepID=UPI001F5088AF|nr:hypothetical protein [Staphylococcus saprophyticus]MDW3933582.1 hypothetical protein [Staphylococcus saprophyticus]MDW4380481.1 hypothetical protein [Staphylococcus saprophyticus]